MFKTDSLTDRLKDAAEARRKRLELFRPKPTVAGPLFEDRAARRASELVRVRAEREQAREDRRQTAADAEAAVQQALADEGAAALDAKRGERKARKVLSATEAKAKRDARYAARQARR